MLKKWDGKFEWYQYPQEDIDTWHLMIDDDGTVYYRTHEEHPRFEIWCPASRLRSHMVRLFQLGIVQAITEKKTAPTLARGNG